MCVQLNTQHKAVFFWLKTRDGHAGHGNAARGSGNTLRRGRHSAAQKDGGETVPKAAAAALRAARGGDGGDAAIANGRLNEMCTQQPLGKDSVKRNVAYNRALPPIEYETMQYCDWS